MCGHCYNSRHVYRIYSGAHSAFLPADMPIRNQQLVRRHPARANADKDRFLNRHIFLTGYLSKAMSSKKCQVLRGFDFGLRRYPTSFDCRIWNLPSPTALLI